MSAMEVFRAIQTYDNASDLEAGGMLAAVLSHVVGFPECDYWRPAAHFREHREAPICIAERIVCSIGALTTSFWLLSGLVMGFLVLEFEVVARAKMVCGMSLDPMSLAGAAPL